MRSLQGSVLADLPRNTVFCKASDRRVLGSINDFVLGAKTYVIETRLPLPEVSRLLNETPMKLLEYGVPSEEMRKLLRQLC